MGISDVVHLGNNNIMGSNEAVPGSNNECLQVTVSDKIGEHLCSLCDMCAYTSNFAKLMVNAGVSICVYCGFC